MAQDRQVSVVNGPPDDFQRAAAEADGSTGGRSGGDCRRRNGRQQCAPNFDGWTESVLHLCMPSTTVTGAGERQALPAGRMGVGAAKLLGTCHNSTKPAFGLGARKAPIRPAAHAPERGSPDQASCIRTIGTTVAACALPYAGESFTAAPSHSFALLRQHSAKLRVTELKMQLDHSEAELRAALARRLDVHEVAQSGYIARGQKDRHQ